MTSILLIEDDEDARRLIAQILIRAGYAVVEASGGFQAMELYKQSTVDLVITDLIMPEKEGIELIMELRRFDPEVKVIAISGGGYVDGSTYLKIAKAVGANGILAKPFKAEELIVLIENFLEVKHR